ncbi:hypothetical protein HDV06_006548 [Boothiomyces sp. JEL0866]|nr:hypothetical protein HDV06_006548 [Boothiomyces sp. JEL0866]
MEHKRQKTEMKVFIFTRDFRLYDNLGLLNQSNVLPIFVFTPQQITNNAYFNHYSCRFLIDSLQDLQRQLEKKKSKLYIFYGEYTSVLDEIRSKYEIQQVILSLDCTPFSRKRDQIINDWCLKNQIGFKQVEDHNIHPLSKIRNGGGSFYKVFTPFFNNCLGFSVPLPQDCNATFVTDELNLSVIPFEEYNRFCDTKVSLPGGTDEALKILESVKAGKFNNYADTRNFPTIETTNLATYLKFGNVSIRHVLSLVKNNHVLKSQLYWREFYFHLTYHMPSVLQKQVSDLPNQQMKLQVTWNTDPKLLELWKEGLTGYPLVDAGMRQLKETGLMHNRIRMICAMFLVKNLQIDWRLGEKYFAQKLLDYDPAQNNGGWQWCASTGVDTTPYRIFNVWLQTKKFDQEAKYIKTWVKELQKVPASDILQWSSAKRKKFGVYVDPIVDHSESVGVAKRMLRGEIIDWGTKDFQR